MNAVVISSYPGSLCSFSVRLKQSLQHGRGRQSVFYEPPTEPNRADLYRSKLRFCLSRVSMYSSFIVFSKIKYDKVGNIYNHIKYYLVGMGKNMYDDKIKISISVTRQDADFLGKLIKTGRAANRSHAVRLAISKLMEAEK